MANGKLIFFGSAEVGLPFLEALRQKFAIGLVISQPDSSGGRNRQSLQPPVARYARQNRLELLQPETLRDASIVERIRSIAPLAAIVVAYGKWIPASIHSLPRFRTLNIHFSLLPRYRGAAPIQRALQNGEPRVGITIFEIAAAMDSGDIWAQKEWGVGPEETAADLLARLSWEGAPFLIETLDQIFAGRLRKRPQHHDLATLAPPLRKDEGRIDWNLTAQQIFNRFRANFPWPGLTFSIPGRTIKVIRAAVSPHSHQASPGEVLALDPRSLQVACGSHTVIEILEIQPPGKKPMPPHVFSLGNRLPAVLH